MDNRRQHIVSFLFIAIIILPIVAITVLQLGQAYIKTSREERLDTEKLEEVVLPAKQVIWEEDGKELWIGKRMFDVASLSIIDGIYHLTGVYDDDETEIAGSLLHTILSKNGVDLLHLLFLLQCFSGSILFIFLLPKYIRSGKQGTFYYLLFPHPCHLVLSPPPRH